MELIGPLLSLLTEVGKLINSDKSAEVMERITELRKLYDMEISKGSGRDDALIYSIRIELCDLCNLYCAYLKGKTS